MKKEEEEEEEGAPKRNEKRTKYFCQFVEASAIDRLNSLIVPTSALIKKVKEKLINGCK